MLQRTKAHIHILAVCREFSARMKVRRRIKLMVISVRKENKCRGVLDENEEYDYEKKRTGHSHHIL